jgi:hypothetical protein
MTSINQNPAILDELEAIYDSSVANLEPPSTLMPATGPA